MESQHPQSKNWLNCTVLGAGLTSLLADLSYETCLSILPSFLAKIGGSSAILGLIEGSADALASFVKLGSGFWSDRIARRKPFAVVGYALTGLMPAIIALAFAWPIVLLARLLGWFGKGLRGPARDALLAASVSSENRGKAFGLHRACDTVGAVLGPLIAAALLKWVVPASEVPERAVMWFAMIPGVLSALAFALLVKEARGAAVKRYRIKEALSQFSPAFRRFLVAVGVFGCGDFTHLLLVATASAALAPLIGTANAAAWGAILYAIRNIAAAVTAFPVGALSDHVGRIPLLILGYALGGLVMIGFAVVALTQVTAIGMWALLFALAGMFIAIEEALEGAAVADLVPDLQLRGTAFGILGVVNGCGDLVSSVMVGSLLAVGPALGFGVAASLMLLGAGVLLLDFAKSAR